MNLNENTIFLIREFMYFSIQAGFATRNEEFPIYNQLSDEFSLNRARMLKNDIKEFLESYFYELSKSNVSENEHKKRIRALSTKITKKYGTMLNDGKFRLGVSQKIINLFLKYLWSAGYINEPHHCPFDNKIKRKIKKYAKDNWLEDWTEMTTMFEYNDYVSAVNVAAKKEATSIALWEAKYWKRI